MFTWTNVHFVSLKPLCNYFIRRNVGAEDIPSHKFAQVYQNGRSLFRPAVEIQVCNKSTKAPSNPPQQSRSLFHSLSIHNYVLERKSAGCLIWIKPHTTVFSHTVCKTASLLVLQISSAFTGAGVIHRLDGCLFKPQRPKYWYIWQIIYINILAIN